MTSRAYREGYDAIDWSKPIPEWRKRPRGAGRAFYIVKDSEPYRSPIDGKVIGGRRQHREHMQEHGVIEVGTEKPKPWKPKPLPDVKADIREAVQMLNEGYRPRPLESYNPNEFE